MAAAADNKTPLAEYEILLCVTGGIACYKVADLTSKLVQAGAGVSVAMTQSAQQFVSPLTFQTLCRRPVYTGMWQAVEDYSSQHISLTDLADVMVVAPATANSIGKIAGGIADDLVSTLSLSATDTCPILIAPAMNSRMWKAPAVQANIEKLQCWGVRVVGPAEGVLACRTTGPGRMSEVPEIFEVIRTLLQTRPPKRARKTALDIGGEYVPPPKPDRP
jgi:phosphopantothenoylcysteine decarboxylase/phosphopantothenate--cysteine ligase